MTGPADDRPRDNRPYRRYAPAGRTPTGPGGCAPLRARDPRITVTPPPPVGSLP
jgi:hypothetical protein